MSRQEELLDIPQNRLGKVVQTFANDGAVKIDILLFLDPVTLRRSWKVIAFFAT
jgi:hypothetical protein